MGNINAKTIHEILEIYEAQLKFEFKDLETKIENFKRINLKLFTDQILEEIEKDQNYDIQDILHRIRQLISDY